MKTFRINRFDYLFRIPFRAILAVLPLGGLVLLFWPAQPLRSDNFVFYSPNASHLVPIQSIGKTSYLPLFQLLNVVGKVKGISAAESSLTVWFEDAELEFRDRDKTVRIGRAKVKLHDPVRVMNGGWEVPVSFVEAVLPRIVHQTIAHPAGTRRFFVGDVKPISFTVRLEPLANGARLILQLTEPVNIRTVSSNGKWVVFLGTRPVSPPEQKFSSHEDYVSGIQFDDQDGIPKLIVTPTSEGLNFFPKVEEGGRVLQADLVKSGPVVAQQPPPPAAAPQATQPTPGAPQPAPSAPELTGPAVVLDAGHGGADAGARGSNGVLEKEITAQLVARVRSALLAEKRYRIVLTRLGDADPSLDQRDATANQARALVFISFHAGNLGVRAPRAVVYTYQPASLFPAPAARRSRAALIPWGSVQLFQLSLSQQFAQAVQSELAKLPGVAVAPPAAAPVRVLRSVNAPAVAVEVGSFASDVDSSALTSLSFQEEFAKAIARAIDTFQGGRS